MSVFVPLGRGAPVTRQLLRASMGVRKASTSASTAASTSTQDAIPAIPPAWRGSAVLDEWVKHEARPISLRQLTVFGRELTEQRLLASAEYCRRELPTRLAHRLRDMQTLPYAALANAHIGAVYALYYSAFELLRKQKRILTLEDNAEFCALLKRTLREHLAVIPKLAMGILEIRDAVGSDDAADRFVRTLLRSRISRRVIAEQHLALTDSFNSPSRPGRDDEFVGQILLKCNAKDIVQRCSATITKLAASAYGPDIALPQIVLQGDLDTVFPYIPSHIEYIVGELLRNSIQAVIERRGKHASSTPPPPIDVLVCQAAQSVVIRVSDQGGGVDRELLPHLWSFVKGHRRDARLNNLSRVPRLAATMQELQPPGEQQKHSSSLSSLASRSPELKLGIGLPMSKIYAEYWAGSLELHSLDGYGCDAFLQISRLGNRNEVLSTRASMDAV